jgi:hypothetical protein
VWRNDSGSPRREGADSWPFVIKASCCEQGWICRRTHGDPTPWQRNSINAPSIQNSCSGQTYLLSFASGTNVDHSSRGLSIPHERFRLAYGWRFGRLKRSARCHNGDGVSLAFSQSYTQYFVRGGLDRTPVGSYLYFGTYRPSGDLGRASVARLLRCTRYILDICAPILPLDAFLNATPRTEKINAGGTGPLLSQRAAIYRETTNCKCKVGAHFGRLKG